MNLLDINVVVSPYAVERKQFRFPHSKKSRIRRKWNNRESNVRYKPRAFKMGNKTIVHPEIYARLQAEIPLTSSEKWGSLELP